MTPEAGPLTEVHNILQQASDQMDSILKQSDSLFLQYTSLVEIMDKVLDYADKLELERNAWRFRAEEMEKKRDQARRLLIELRMQAGEGCCPGCGALSAIVVREGSDSWVECPECGQKGDVA